MKIEFSCVADAGTLRSERIVLHVVTDSDIGGYVLIWGENTNGKSIASGGQTKTFWFPDQKVKAGDYVVLYTRVGETSTKTREDGKTNYFYYWDLDAPLWTAGHTPVLLEVNEWKAGTRFE